jgi:DHA2 family multidrug resistance protein-like MFS transporter
MPLLPIDLFRRPIFSVSVTTSVLCFIAQGLAFVSLPFYFQDVIGVSAVATGLLMTPWPATSALMAPFAGRLADRYPAGILGSIGLAIVGVGFVLLAVLPAHPGTGDILWRIAVCGGGMGRSTSPTPARSSWPRRASAAVALARFKEVRGCSGSRSARRWLPWSSASAWAVVAPSPRWCSRPALPRSLPS